MILGGPRAVRGETHFTISASSAFFEQMAFSASCLMTWRGPSIT